MICRTQPLVSRRRWMAVAGLMFTCFGGSITATATTVRPNGLLLASDDLRPALGAYRESLAKTPLAPMLALPGIGGDPAAINFSELPILRGEHTFVTHGNLPWGFRNHSYLAYHDGQYWCMWSQGPAQEDRIGQRVAYATLSLIHI